MAVYGCQWQYVLGGYITPSAQMLCFLMLLWRVWQQSTRWSFMPSAVLSRFE
jgi:hypothetical protein